MGAYTLAPLCPDSVAGVVARGHAVATVRRAVALPEVGETDLACELREPGGAARRAPIGTPEAAEERNVVFYGQRRDDLQRPRFWTETEQHQSNPDGDS